MNEIEEILNSGKLYHVMDVTSKDTQYHEYLRKNVYINLTAHSLTMHRFSSGTTLLSGRVLS